MERRFWLRSKALIVGLVLVLMLGSVVWVERTPLRAWYYVRELAAADEKDQAAWVARVVEMDVTVLPQLIELLHRTDMQPCTNARTALLELVKHWPPGDGRREDFAGLLADGFAGMSPEGQQAALDIQADLAKSTEGSTSSPAVLSAATRVLAGVCRQSEPQVRTHALALAEELVRQTKHAEVVSTCQELVRTCLRDPSASNRLLAVQLAQRPGIDLQEPLVRLLTDPEAEVRRAALLAVGTSENAIATDDLLPWLHDPDGEVRRLCEKALRSRGLQEDHLKLGRLMTDHRPGTRLEVLDLLSRANDLEPGVWLRRLSHDPSPAVRAAAVRAAAEQRSVNLADRLEQMAQNDPSATVRQLAQYYLSSQKPATKQPVSP
jgi:hypothetical protein